MPSPIPSKNHKTSSSRIVGNEDVGSVSSDQNNSTYSVGSTYRHQSSSPFMSPPVVPSSSTSSSTTTTTSHLKSTIPVAAAVAASASLLEEMKPKPVLVKDTNHVPKTTGSFGLLIVGLGGANGLTLLAGILANRMNINWRGPRGEHMKPNYYGCITQLQSKGGGVGYKDRIKGLADASMAAIGGWVRVLFVMFMKCLIRTD